MYTVQGVVLDVKHVGALAVQGRFEFSEGTSAKWIFDVEIVKLKTQIFLNVKKTKIMLGFDGIRLFLFW